MTRAFHRIAALLTACVVTAGAEAAVVNYVEFSDGDLQLAPVPSLLIFDMAGVHTVSGNIMRGEIDSFLFDIGAGLELTAFEIEAFTFPASGVRTAVSNFRLHPLGPGGTFPFNPFYHAQLDFISGDVTVIDPLDAPVGAGSYRVQNGHANTAFSEFPRFGAEYTLRFTVEGAAPPPAPVPLPASALSLLVGLGGLAALRRRA